jgi:hypothetical protein
MNEDLSYLNSEYARRKMVEEYNKESNIKEAVNYGRSIDKRIIGERRHGEINIENEANGPRLD